MPSPSVSIAPAVPSQHGDIAHAYRQAFGFPEQRSATYIDDVGLNNFRILSVEGRFAAVMAVIDTAHWLGGRPVRAVNIAHVAINPVWRGAGLAGRFLDLVLAEARDRGTGLATLFASTRPVYRRAGFALAGLEMIYEAETTALPRVKGTGFTRLDPAAARAVIAPLYQQQCRQQAGLLDRHAAHWASLLAGSPDIFVSTVDAAPGYIVVDTSDTDCLVVRDWAALNGLAASHLLTLLGTFASVYPRLRWHGAPQDPLVFALPDKGWHLAHQEEWLAKVLDPVPVLEQRGYAGVDADLGIDLVAADAVRALTLRLRNGAGRCEARNDALPTVRIALADLGTLVTGHRSASFLARAGVLSGDAAAVRLCDTVFAGPQPWVGEHF